MREGVWIRCGCGAEVGGKTLRAAKAARDRHDRSVHPGKKPVKGSLRDRVPRLD